VAAREDSDPVELTISADTVGIIISTARRFDADQEETDPDDEAGSAALDEEEAAHDFSENPAAAELREMIEDLNDDEVIDLIALAWVGRGDYGREEWEEARGLARERRRRHSADYLMGMPALGDYLEEGLTALGHTYEAP
jgi:hypothetical protein